MHDERRFPDYSPPEDWKSARLDQIFSRVTTRNTVQNDTVLTPSAEFGLISQESFFNRRVASKDLRPYYLLEPGDFVYNKSYSTGYPFGAISRLVGNSPGVVSPLYICLRPSSDCCDYRFLAYSLGAGALDKGIDGIAKEGARNHGLLNVSVQDFLKLPLSLPPLGEQSAIAEVLDTVDAAIRRTEEVVAKLELVKKGLLHDLLTRGIDENGELRDPERHPEQFKESELGRIPRGWALAPLGQFLNKIDAGWSPSCPERPPGTNEWGVLKVSAVTSGSYMPSEAKVLPEDLRPRPELEVKSGDVILTRANGVAALVGVAVEVTETPPRLLLSDKTLRLRPTSRVDQGFLALEMMSTKVRRQIQRLLSGSSGQKNISQAQIHALEVIIPPLEEQQEVVARVRGLDKLVAAEELSLSKLRLLKKALMDDLLTGKVRVTPLLEKEKEEPASEAAE